MEVVKSLNADMSSVTLETCSCSSSHVNYLSQYNLVDFAMLGYWIHVYFNISISVLQQTEMSYQKVCLYFAFDFISVMMVTKPVMIFFHFPPPPVLDVEYFITHPRPVIFPWTSTDCWTIGLSIMHPFGREEETSRRELFGFFTRCLRRGEWELAAACVRQLGDERGDDPQSPRDIVKAIVTHPYLLRSVKPWQKSTGMLIPVIINHMSLCRKQCKQIHFPLSVDVAYCCYSICL